MKITDTPTSFAAPQLPRRAATPEEAAKQFEQVLVKQFVDKMTDGLFKTSLSGEDGPGWVGAYGDMQQDALSENLAQHLVQSGTLRISELLLRQWKQAGRLPDDAPAPDAGV